MFGSFDLDNSKFTIIKLGDAAKVGSSHRVFTNEFVDEGVPFYRGTEISELSNGTKPSKPFYISLEHYNKISNDDTKPQIGDILMPSICDKGQLWLVDTNLPFYYKDGRVLCISPNKNLFVPSFLHYFLKIKTISEYKKIGSGSTFAEFKIFQLKNINVILPPKNQQEKFSEILKQIDKSKFLLQQILEKLELLKKSRFIEMFKDINLATQKKEWIELRCLGKIVSGTTPKTDKENYWNGENLWITPAELRSDSYVVSSTERKITTEGIKSCSLQMMPKNTVLLTSRAPIGKVAISGVEMYCNQGFKNIVCKEELNPKYLYYLLKFNNEFLNSLGRGATFKEISKSILEKVKIPLPPISRQSEFVAFAEQIDKSKLIIQKALEDLVGKV